MAQELSLDTVMEIKHLERDFPLLLTSRIGLTHFLRPPSKGCTHCFLTSQMSRSCDITLAVRWYAHRSCREVASGGNGLHM